jgi:hypothetical protein
MPDPAAARAGTRTVPRVREAPAARPKPPSRAVVPTRSPQRALRPLRPRAAPLGRRRHHPQCPPGGRGDARPEEPCTPARPPGSADPAAVGGPATRSRYDAVTA